MDPIALNIHGIKCDNPKCTYQNMDVPYKDYPSWLNKPCPECGENLLTNEDFETTKQLVEMTNTINQSADTIDLNKLDSPESPKVAMTINLDGSGKPSFEEIKIVDDNELSREIELNKTYRHFKGGLYIPEMIAHHTETHEKLVIYRPQDTIQYFARPYDMFLSKVDIEKYPDTKQTYRMELID